MIIEQRPSPTEPPLATHAAGAPITTKLGLLAYGVAILTLALDQASKIWILDGLRLPERLQVPVLPFLNFTMVWNPGVSFGLFKAGGEVGRLMLAAFAAAVVTALAFWARTIVRPLTAVGLGLVMGGAVGNNLVDRLRFGRVVDFIDVGAIGFFPWVFNVADSAISIGVVLLIIDSILPAAASPTVKTDH
jgi:signal peptidase II